MSLDKTKSTTRREFVKHVAAGATGLAAAGSLDPIAGNSAANPQIKDSAEYRRRIEAVADFKDSLTRIVRADSVVSDPAVLDTYSGDFSFVAPGAPLLVAYPERREEVEEIVRLANRSRMPLVPISSGPPRFHGDTVPSQGAVIVDFSRMNRIVKIDPVNRCVQVESGVTYGQLVPELRKHGMRLSNPLLPRANKSVVASRLEREPTLIPKYQFDYIDPLLTLGIVYGTGDEFRTGSASGPGALESLKADKVNPWGPGTIDYCKFLTGAQGTMGLVTWAATKIEVLPSLQKLYFIPIQDVHDLTSPVIGLLRRRAIDECLALNNVNLAAILAENWPGDFEELKRSLPLWTVVACVAGYERRPEERLNIQEKYLKEICRGFGLKPQVTLPGAAGKEDRILELLSSPWDSDPYWKLRYKKSCHDIFFLTTLSSAPDFIGLMKTVVARYRFPGDDLGAYVQPMVQGRGCHCEFSLPCDPSDLNEVEEVRNLFLDASETLMKNGAFFSRPYGPWADMIFTRSSQDAEALKKLKSIFDTKAILNPGKLCF
jgi:hypothetical protein